MINNNDTKFSLSQKSGKKNVVLFQIRKTYQQINETTGNKVIKKNQKSTEKRQKKKKCKRNTNSAIFQKHKKNHRKKRVCVPHPGCTPGKQVVTHHPLNSRAAGSRSAATATGISEGYYREELPTVCREKYWTEPLETGKILDGKTLLFSGHSQELTQISRFSSEFKTCQMPNGTL